MAERKAGEILARMENAKPGRKAAVELDDATAPNSRLKDIGITNKQSSRWQQSAKVPEPVFEEYVATSTATGKEITSAGLYKLANKVAPKVVSA